MKSFVLSLAAVSISLFLVTPAVAQLPCYTFCFEDGQMPSVPKQSNPYNYSNNYGADFYAPPPASSYTPRSYNHSLGSGIPMPQYRYDGTEVGSPTAAEQFEAQERRMDRIDQRNWRLQNLYQNQKPAACGPAFDPRARVEC